MIQTTALGGLWKTPQFSKFDRLANAFAANDNVPFGLKLIEGSLPEKRLKTPAPIDNFTLFNRLNTPSKISTVTF